MVKREGKFDAWYTIDERKKLVELYGTNHKPTLQKLIKERSLMTNEELLRLLGVDATGSPTDYKTRTEIAKCLYWEEKARLEKCKADMAEQKALYVGIFKSDPSPQAEQAIKTRAENLAKQQNTSILRTDGTLKCISCGKTFQQKAYGFQQADEYRNHVRNGHNRELYSMENQTCLELANK